MVHDNMITKTWQKLSETDDLISIEKETSYNYKIRIEGRLNKSTWQIFKTYFTNQEVSFVEEYTTETRPEALNIISALKKERDLMPSEIKNIKKLLGEKLALKMERAYKEYEVEKWNFSINDEKMVNFATIRYCEYINVDIVLHEKYRYLERKIIEEVVNVLGLKEFGLDICKNVYFFSKRTFYKTKPKHRGVVISKIEMDFNDASE
jgi:hypothetical protein